MRQQQLKCLNNATSHRTFLLQSTPPPPLSIDARPNNGFDRSKDAAGFKPSRPELVPLETCFDHHMEASLHAPPPPSYSQCSLNNALAKRREERSHGHGNGHVMQRAISERPSSPIWKEASVETHLSAPNTPSFERGRMWTGELVRTPSNAKARRQNFSKSRTCDWVKETNQAPPAPAPGACSSLPTMCPAARTHAQAAPAGAIDAANPPSSSGRRSRDTGDAARFYVPAFDSSGSLTPDDASASRSKRSGDYGPQRTDSDVETPGHVAGGKKSSRPGVFLPGAGGAAGTTQGGATSATQDVSGKVGTAGVYDRQTPPAQYDNMQHVWMHPNRVKHFEV